MIREINTSQQTHLAGHNRFSDWTELEYLRLFNTVEMPRLSSDPVKSNQQVANDVNWLTNGVVGGV